MILFTGATSEVPIAVFGLLRVEVSEGVDEALVFEESAERGALFGCEAGPLVFTLGSKYVQLLMSDVQVSAEDNWFVLRQL